MSSDQPVFDRTPLAPPPGSRSGGHGWMIIVTIFGAVGFICLGLVILAYLAVQQATSVPAELELPARGHDWDAAQAQFNQSLAQPLNASAATAAGDEDGADDNRAASEEVRHFVQHSMALMRSGIDVPFHQEMFIESVAASRHSRGSLGMIDRLLLRSWLSDYVPTPSVDEHERVLAVRVDNSGKFATVDLLSYSAEEQARSYQWFLVKVDEQWKMYDWQRMEYGRRMSDEYAAYVRGELPEAEGYDQAMTRLAEAEQTWLQGNQEEARRQILACEQMPVLKEDLASARLRTAYTWLSVGQYDEAIRVLKSIDQPEQMWGVWTVLGACYSTQDEQEKALLAALRAQQQSPDHPNVHWLLSTVYEALDRTQESADEAAIALRICPDDASLFFDVVTKRRTQDIPLLLNSMDRGGIADGWSPLFAAAAGSTEWAEAFLEQVTQRPDLPQGVRELAQGNLAWSQADYDTSAEHFLQASRVARVPALKSTGLNDHLSARLQNEQFAELLSESDDVDATLAKLAQWAYDDEVECDPNRLLAALQQPTLQDNPWARALRGWAHYHLDQDEQALPEFSIFLDWLKSAAQTNSDNDWLANTAGYYIAQSLLELQRPMEVLDRWPVDIDRHEQVGAFLLQQNDAAAMSEFLAATADTGIESVRLQRLRLQSAMAMLRGDPQQCDRWQREAIQLGRALYHEDRRYLVNRMIYRRGRDLVWNRLPDAEVAFPDDDDFNLRDQLIITTVKEAYQIDDRTSLDSWVGRANAAGIRNGESYATLQHWLGAYRQSQGDLEAAIDALQISLRNTDTDQRWYYSRRRELLIRLMLETHAVSSLQQWLDEEPADRAPSEVPSAALLALAKRDVESLQQILDGLEPATVASWLDDLADWLEQQADDAWLSGLLKKYPLAIRWYPAQSAGQLLWADDPAIDVARVQELLSASLDESFALTPVPLDGEDDDRQAYLAASPQGQRVLVSWSPATYESDGLGEWLAKRLQHPVHRLTIEVLDHKPRATRRLFAIAALAAVSDAIAFSWNGTTFWTGPDLRQQLQWQQRVPVHPQLHSGSLSTRIDESVSQPEFISVEQWNSRLASAADPLTVILRQSTSHCSEAIPCELAGVDVEEYELLIRPQRDGVIDPLVKKGFQYTCDPASVRPAAE